MKRLIAACVLLSSGVVFGAGYFPPDNSGNVKIPNEAPFQGLAGIEYPKAGVGFFKSTTSNKIQLACFSWLASGAVTNKADGSKTSTAHIYVLLDDKATIEDYKFGCTCYAGSGPGPFAGAVTLLSSGPASNYTGVLQFANVHLADFSVPLKNKGENFYNNERMWPQVASGVMGDVVPAGCDGFASLRAVFGDSAILPALSSWNIYTRAGTAQAALAGDNIYIGFYEFCLLWKEVGNHSVNPLTYKIYKNGGYSASIWYQDSANILMVNDWQDSGSSNFDKLLAYNQYPPAFASSVMPASWFPTVTTVENADGSIDTTYAYTDGTSQHVHLNSNGTEITTTTYLNGTSTVVTTVPSTGTVTTVYNNPDGSSVTNTVIAPSGSSPGSTITSGSNPNGQGAVVYTIPGAPAVSIQNFPTFGGAPSPTGWNSTGSAGGATINGTTIKSGVNSVTPFSALEVKFGPLFTALQSFVNLSQDNYHVAFSFEIVAGTPTTYSFDTIPQSGSYQAESINAYRGFLRLLGSLLVYLYWLKRINSDLINY